MPMLTYKYIMNEPFINGTADQTNTSHSANENKLKLKGVIQEDVKMKKQEIVPAPDKAAELQR